MLLITSEGVQGQGQTRTEGTGFYMGERGRSEHQGPVGTGEWGGGGRAANQGNLLGNRGGTLQQTGTSGDRERGEHRERGLNWNGTTVQTSRT